MIVVDDVAGTLARFGAALRAAGLRCDAGALQADLIVK